MKAKLRAAMEERGRNGSAEEKDEEEEITARPAQAKAGPSKTKAKVASPVKAKMTKSKKVSSTRVRIISRAPPSRGIHSEGTASLPYQPAESDDNQEDRVPPKKAKKPTSVRFPCLLLPHSIMIPHRNQADTPSYSQSRRPNLLQRQLLPPKQNPIRDPMSLSVPKQ